MGLGRKEIKICMGSSCFSRGNRDTLKIIQHYLNDNGLETEVFLKGNHCFSDCASGPVLKIGPTIYEQVTSENVLAILEKEFNI